jgi:hypothetical protein
MENMSVSKALLVGLPLLGLVLYLIFAAGV